MPKSAPVPGLPGRLLWFVTIRWAAFLGVCAVIFFAASILRLPLPLFPLYATAGFLGFYNFIFFLFLRRRGSGGEEVAVSSAGALAHIQIALDLATLALLLHFSGGIENPFALYFIFHMILASILLSRRAAFIQAGFAVFLFSGVVLGERAGLLPHTCLTGLLPHLGNAPLSYLAGFLFVFASTLIFAVYMTSSIAAELRERERNLQDANALLEEKDRIKSEYVLRVSHDIKEHLSAIQSCLEPVERGLTGPLNEKQKNLLERAEARTGKLLSFVRALLAVTRLKLKREITTAAFSLKESVESALSFVEERAKARQIHLEYTYEASQETMEGEQVTIEETLVNIFTNSLKYTPSGGKVKITVRDQGVALLVLVADTGIGIPPEEMPKIFEEFYRASNAREVERTGTGLGLSFARQVVERHGGKIWAESQLGRGSTFFILLPKCKQ